MAVASPEKKNDSVPKPPEGDEVPYAPPEETFWHRYSWHGEFPISIVASILLVISVGGIVLAILDKREKDKKTAELPPVPTIGLKIAEGDRGGTKGGGGGDSTPKEVVPDTPVEPQREIPAAQLKKEMISASKWVPDLDNKALERIVQSPNFERLSKLNDDVRRRIGQGFVGGTGKGKSSGAGVGDTPGTGDASSSGNRSVRWVILFRTQNGKDYVEQLNAFKAKIVIPEPPKWETNLLFEDILKPKPKKLENQSLPKMYFVDEDPNSASKVARALGLEYDPPNFIAFFPKDVEEELAAKERAFKGRREEQIYSTTFRVTLVNGKYQISVTDQIPQKK